MLIKKNQTNKLRFYLKQGILIIICIIKHVFVSYAKNLKFKKVF